MYAQKRIKRADLYVVHEGYVEYVEHEGYVEYVEDKKPLSIWRILKRIPLLCVVFLFIIPSAQDVSPLPIMTRLEFLPLQTLTATVAIQPTGVQVIPAINARGMLTVYNGSFLVQQLPRGSIVESSGGVQIVTDEVVVVPPVDPPALGQARVQAHAVVAGASGNVSSFSINAVYLTSLYVKNLTAFSGGTDAYTVRVATGEDKATALMTASYKLRNQTKLWVTKTRMLDRCDKTASEVNLMLTATWTCQFLQYHVEAGQQVLSAKRVGKSVILQVRR